MRFVPYLFQEWLAVALGAALLAVAAVGAWAAWCWLRAAKVWIVSGVGAGQWRRARSVKGATLTV